MKPWLHVVSSVALSLPALLAGNWWMAVACVVFGGFMDVDHQLDFYLLFGRFTWSLSELSEKLDRYNKPTFFCPLHSWEFLVLLVVLSFWFDMFAGAALGVAAHLLGDILFNEREEFHFSRWSFLLRWRTELMIYEDFRRHWLASGEGHR